MNYNFESLANLLPKGASLGGAGAKANVTQVDDTRWIAKFPAKDDDKNMSAWEMLAHKLATACKINMPDAKLLRLGSQ